MKAGKIHVTSAALPGPGTTTAAGVGRGVCGTFQAMSVAGQPAWQAPNAEQTTDQTGLLQPETDVEAGGDGDATPAPNNSFCSCLSVAYYKPVRVASNPTV
jgi:hypothetical protein